jgi:hypothetical protein
MEKLDIGCLTRDYITLRSGIFKNDTHLAWNTRKRFMHTPGITSFEVSPYTGKVFIGLDRNVVLDEGARQEVMALLQTFFPELVDHNRFQHIFYTLH